MCGFSQQGGLWGGAGPVQRSVAQKYGHASTNMGASGVAPGVARLPFFRGEVPALLCPTDEASVSPLCYVCCDPDPVVSSSRVLFIFSCLLWICRSLMWPLWPSFCWKNVRLVPPNRVTDCGYAQHVASMSHRRIHWVGLHSWKSCTACCWLIVMEK